MEESVEDSILPVILIAILILVVIGIIVWVVLSRRVVSPPPTPIPIVPLTPTTNTTNVANPPASIPIIRVTSRCDKKRNHEDDSCEDRGHGDHTESVSSNSDSAGEMSCQTSSGSEMSDKTSSGSDVGSNSGSSSSTRTEGDNRCIYIYNHSLKMEERLDVPEEDMISISHCSGELYSCTDSRIYVREDEEWNLIGSVEETIIELIDDEGRLRVRTDSGDYFLARSNDGAKMSQCHSKRRLHGGEDIYLDEDKLYVGGKSLSQDVTCFYTNGYDLLTYVKAGRLYIDNNGHRSSKKIECKPTSACASDRHIYLLVNEQHE